jgi:hypothetical protein
MLRDLINEKNIRFRHLYMGVGSFLVILMWVITDPDLGWISELPIGSGTIATLLVLLKVVLYVGMLHISRRAMADYLDMFAIYQKAVETPTGAGLAAIAVSMLALAISVVMYAATA